MTIQQIEVWSLDSVTRWLPWVPHWDVPAVGDVVILQRPDKELSNAQWRVKAMRDTGWCSGHDPGVYYVRDLQRSGEQP